VAKELYKEKYTNVLMICLNPTLVLIIDMTSIFGILIKYMLFKYFWTAWLKFVSNCSILEDV
jgi:hypothetical protein